MNRRQTSGPTSVIGCRLTTPSVVRDRRIELTALDLLTGPDVERPKPSRTREIGCPHQLVECSA